jgi:hypothetical protein
MQLALLFALSIPAGCFLSPTTVVQRATNTAHAQSAPAQRDPFQTPHEGLKLTAATAETALTLAELTTEFSRVTGETLLIDPQARQLLQSTTVGLNRTIDVPPAEVYFVVETLLVQNGFVLTRLNDREPRMLALNTTSGPGPVRARAVLVPIDSIDVWARHPAFLITTALDLPNTDVRVLSNSVRALFTDANTQQLIPVGNSSTLMITSFGPEVASIVGMLREVDAATAREIARRDAKPEAEKSVPKPETPPGK